MVKRGIHVSGTSPESISSLLLEVAECGTHYTRLSHFSLQPVLDSSCSKGLVFQVGPAASREAVTDLAENCTHVWESLRGPTPDPSTETLPCNVSN